MTCLFMHSFLPVESGVDLLHIYNIYIHFILEEFRNFCCLSFTKAKFKIFSVLSITCEIFKQVFVESGRDPSSLLV